jgi:hypothetical protein
MEGVRGREGQGDGGEIGVMESGDLTVCRGYGHGWPPWLLWLTCVVC